MWRGRTVAAAMKPSHGGRSGATRILAIPFLGVAYILLNLAGFLLDLTLNLSQGIPRNLADALFEAALDLLGDSACLIFVHIILRF